MASHPVASYRKSLYRVPISVATVGGLEREPAAEWLDESTMVGNEHIHLGLETDRGELSVWLCLKMNWYGPISEATGSNRDRYLC